jgi:peptidoglycan/xylan/chitin deacetylase (PgdA/CDA1 family)
MRTAVLILAVLIPLHGAHSQSAGSDTVIQWPDGKRAALSLTFDDARLSQIDAGIPLLDRYDVKATFFVVPGAVEERLEGWRNAQRAGHEIGNHSFIHPCTGNFPWARDKALEDYSLEKMREELLAANRRVEELLGVSPDVFAYPCGQKFVGRGLETKSYVPLVAETFMAARGWLDEAPNDPEFVDPAQVLGMEMDGVSFSELLPVIEQAKEGGLWVVLAGHEIGESGNQTTHLDMLEELIRYAEEPSNQVWLAPFGTVASHVLEQRK